MPQRPMLEAKDLDEISDVLSGISQKKEVKLIIFEGSGKHFSFGASVHRAHMTKAAMMLKFFHRMFYQLVDLAIPTMAIVRGQCLGGGMELALFCNFIIADQNSNVRSTGNGPGRFASSAQSCSIQGGSGFGR